MTFSIPLLVGLMVTVLALVLVVRPVFRSSPLQPGYLSGRTPRELEGERDAALAEARRLDIDLRTGKLSTSDHEVLRARAVRQAAMALQAIDDLAIGRRAPAPGDRGAEIEQMVKQFRASSAVGSGPKCQRCGSIATENAAYCARCGTRLE